MALDRMNIYYQKAHRLSGNKVSAKVTEVQPGQLFHLNDSGEWEYADGTRPAFPTLNARYAGKGRGLQGELLEGRDNVSRVGMITCLKGNYELGTDQYDKTASFTFGQPITSGKKGLAVPATDTTKAHLIIGTVTKIPTQEYPFLRYEG
jgi:hypothetical protein